MDQSCATQDLVSGADGRPADIRFGIDEIVDDLARTPFGVRGADGHDRFGNRDGRPMPPASRCARTVDQTMPALLIVLIDELVPSLARDPVLEAQRAHRGGINENPLQVVTNKS